MSAPMLELEERPAVRVEPAKQWRNWYWVIAPIKLHTPIQAIWRRGVHPGPHLFPSKDIAEAYAIKFLAQQTPDFRWRIEYHEAFPEGVTPE